MSFLSYVSRINIEIGRSFMHRSFPRRVEYPYLSERGRQASRRNKKNSLRRLGSRFSYPLSPLPPSFLSRPSSFSLCLRSCYRVFVSLSSWRFLEGSALFPFARFFLRAFTPTPGLFTPGRRCLLPRSFLAFRRVRRRRSILSGRSSLDHWPGRKLEHVSTL